jgi:leucyl/phenylalanyl-tRNA---protein transferase
MDPREADVEGLVGAGADLEAATLVGAYRSGIFPWPHEGLPLLWFSPDPRACFTPGEVRRSRSLRRTLRRSGWESTVDRAFTAVVEGCAARTEGTWITAEMRDAYVELHELGWAHSVEVWEDDELVGGIYGVQLGGVFTGESMFHRRTDASKVALLDLSSRLAEAGARLLDVQLVTDHLATLGVRTLERDRFLAVLAAHRDDPVQLPSDRRPVARLGG